MKPRDTIESIIDYKIRKYPEYGTVRVIDGDLVDVSLPSSATHFRHLKVIGDVGKLRTGDTVRLRWVYSEDAAGKIPMVEQIDKTATTIGAVVPDNATLENSTEGIRIRVGGIQPEHLGFRIASNNNTDMLSDAGWAVTSDGVIYAQNTFIHPTGQIVLGSGDNTIKLDSQHATYRFWAGDVDPALAPFSVQKTGEIYSISGSIGGWTISTTGLASSDGKAALVPGANPYVKLGDSTAYMTGTGFWVGKDVDTVYKLHLGNPAGDHMRWDGSVLFITGSFAGSSQLSGTSSNSFTINDDSSAGDVTLVFDHASANATFTWNGTILALDRPLTLTGNLNFSAAYSITTSADNLTLAPAGDVTMDPAGKEILPAVNYDISIGSVAKKFLNLHVAELWVETLVAQNTLATIGGRILVGPTTVLTSDLAPAGTTLVVKHNSLSPGDVIYLEANSNVEFMSITSGPTGTGPYSYVVSRNLDGSGADQWYAGDAAFNTGAAGEGFIDMFSIAGVAGVGTGPAIVGNVRSSSTYNDWEEHWAIGNLNGQYGYGVTTYGVGVGKYGADHIVIDPTNGVRFRYGNTVMGKFTGSSITLGDINDHHTIIATTGIQLRDYDTVRIEMQSDGDVFIGADLAFPSTTTIAIFNTAQTYNSESVGIGDVLIGDNSTGKPNLLWDYSTGDLLFRSGTTSNIKLNTSGQLVVAGTLFLDNSGLTLVGTGQNGYDEYKIAYDTGSGLKGTLRFFTDYVPTVQDNSVTWLLASKFSGDPWTKVEIEIRADDNSASKAADIYLKGTDSQIVLTAESLHLAGNTTIDGTLTTTNHVTIKKVTAPSTPAAEYAVIYLDTSQLSLIAKDEYGFPQYLYNDWVKEFPVMDAYLSGATFSMLNSLNPTIVYRDAQSDVAVWQIRFPNPWLYRKARFAIRWLTTTASPTGNVRWVVDLTMVRDAIVRRTTPDASGTVETAVGAQDTWKQSNIDIYFSSTFGNGDFANIRLYRDGTHANDTHTSSVYMGSIGAFLYAVS